MFCSFLEIRRYIIGVIKSCIEYTLMEIPGVIKKPPVSSFRHSIKSFFSILIYSIIVGKHTLGVKTQLFSVQV